MDGADGDERLCTPQHVRRASSSGGTSVLLHQRGARRCKNVSLIITRIRSFAYTSTNEYEDGGVSRLPQRSELYLQETLMIRLRFVGVEKSALDRL